MYELFRIGNDVLPYILAVRSTKVFAGQLFNGAVIGGAVAVAVYVIFLIFKKWKNKR